MHEITIDNVREAALRILDFGDCSRAEMKRKLLKKKYDPSAIEEVLDGLEEVDILDDQRYAENYMRSAMERGKGPLWIRSKLLEKGVSSDRIALASEALSFAETERARCLRKALSLCGLSTEYEVDENECIVPADGCISDSSTAEDAAGSGSISGNGRLDYFGRGIPDDMDRYEARALRAKAKARLTRRLAGAGFTAAAVSAAVSAIDAL